MVWWCVQANLIVVARCVFIHHKGVIIAGWRRHSVMIYIETDRWSQTVRYWWDIECQHISGISNKVSDSPWSLWLSIYWLCFDICWNQNKFESHKTLSLALHALVWLTLWLWPRVWGLCCNVFCCREWVILAERFPNWILKLIVSTRSPGRSLITWRVWIDNKCLTGVKKSKLCNWCWTRGVSVI